MSMQSSLPRTVESFTLSQPGEQRKNCIICSGGFRNLERGVQPLACEAEPEIFGVITPTSGHVNVRTEYLEATLGVVKRLEISKELCNCAWLLLLHATAVQSLLATKGGCICTPLTPPKSTTDMLVGMNCPGQQLMNSVNLSP